MLPRRGGESPTAWSQKRPHRADLGNSTRQTDGVLPAIRIADADYFKPRSAFRRGASARPLEVWVDVASLSASPDLDHLLGLATSDQLDLFCAKPVDGGHLTTLMLHAGQAGARAENTNGFSLLGGGPVDRYRKLISRWAADEPGREQDALLDSALLASVAERHRADVFVTGAEPVLAHIPGANPMSVLEGLAVIGLHLRSADDFQVAKGHHYNRGLFYWLLARELVPSWGPSWRGLVEGNRDSGDFLNGLPHALIVRVDQVLRARDRLHVELKLPQDNDSSDEAVFALDALLVSLDACFDVIARVLNRCHAVGRKDSAARWRDNDWVEKLLKSASRLTGVVGSGTAFADAVDLIGAWRLSLHGVPFQTMAYGDSLGRVTENLLVVPPEQQEKIVEIMARRGGSSYWGVRPGIDSLVLVDIRSFVEVLTQFALEALETAVAAAVGPRAELDRRGDWGDTRAVRHQLRALSGTVGWNYKGQRPVVDDS